MPLTPNDPLTRYGRPLVAALLAVAASVVIAALIGGLMPFSYTGRALTYVALLVYVIVGGVVVFRTVAQAEQQPLNLVRLAKWIVSLWVWPLLLMRR